MFHHSQLGRFGDDLPRDLDGYVPQNGDEPTSFRWAHDAFTADFDAHGNGYVGSAREEWALMVQGAVAATAEAEAALTAWRRQ